MKYKFAFVTSCMGRLDHLKQSAKLLMQDPRIGDEWLWVVVDYACPEKSGEWIESEYGDRVKVLSIQPPEGATSIVFNKPLALNSGAMTAIQEGADYLAFIDADTLVTPKFLDWIDSYASLDSFLMCNPELAKRDLTGFLCVNHRHFLRVGGYNVAFKGWGAEDLELRVRLFLDGVGFHEIPSDFASSIAHGDDLRTAHYEEKDKDESHGVNLNQLCASVFQRTGKHLIELYQGDQGIALRRLLGIEPFSPRDLFIK